MFRMVMTKSFLTGEVFILIVIASDFKERSNLILLQDEIATSLKLLAMTIEHCDEIAEPVPSVNEESRSSQ